MKIAIVGAGITGALLASKLAAGGHNPFIFEKSRGRGGRCTYKRTDWAEFDLGAPVVPAWEQDFTGFMEAQVDSGLAANWPRQVFEFDGQLAVTANTRRQFVFSGGMNAACVSWLQDLPLLREHRIEGAKNKAGKWHLTDSLSAEHGPFDCLVITAPWPQTAQLLREISGNAQHHAQQNWSSCWTVALQLDRPIDTESQLIYLRDLPVQTLIQDSAKPGRKAQAKQLWIAHLNHELSAQLGKDGAEQALALAEHSLQQVFSASQIHTANHYCHYWRYARPAPQQEGIGLIADRQIGLFAGGDWSMGASIQAAYQAASQLYDEILSLS